MLLRKHAILGVLLMLGGCADTYEDFGRHHMWTPSPVPFLMKGIPQGYDSYSIGFRDGCNTMIGVLGSGMLRMHDMSYDANRGLKDKDYYLGWRIGQNYCTYYLDKDPL